VQSVVQVMGAQPLQQQQQVLQACLCLQRLRQQQQGCLGRLQLVMLLAICLLLRCQLCLQPCLGRGCRPLQGPGQQQLLQQQLYRLCCSSLQLVPLLLQSPVGVHRCFSSSQQQQ
jgi:hypothetical protein